MVVTFSLTILLGMVGCGAMMINSKAATNVIVHSIAELTALVCDDDLGIALSAHNLGNALSHCASLLVLNGL